jgi:hypothetical protein
MIMFKVREIVFSVLFVLCTSFNLFSQPVTVTSETGLIAGTSANIGGYDATQGSIVSGGLAAYMRIDRHELSIGLLYPFVVPYVRSYDEYGDIFKIGASASYKFYLFSIRHAANLFLQYEFQYVYFSGTTYWSSHTEPFEASTVNQFFRSTFSVGFTCFFNKSHRSFFSVAGGYMIPCEYLKTETGREGYNYTEWNRFGAGDHMENYINLSLNVGFKLSPLKKKSDSGVVK